MTKAYILHYRNTNIMVQFMCDKEMENISTSFILLIPRNPSELHIRTMNGDSTVLLFVL